MAPRETNEKGTAEIQVPSSKTGRDSVTIYRPFFIAGILSVLTVGCLLGAIALAGIARKESYTASAWTPFVLAHANSQLFGWVGFFVMGFALQQHAPSVHRARSFCNLAYLSLGLMAVGIAVRFVAEPLVHTDPRWRTVGVISGVLQLISILLFQYNSGVNRERASGRLPWPTIFIFTSLIWLTVCALAEPWVFFMSHQPDPEASIVFVARWFAPLREAQFLGFVAMMIFGVSLSRFAGYFALKTADPRLGVIGFTLWIAGLMMRVYGWLSDSGESFISSGAPWIRWGSVLLGLGAMAIVLSLRIFECSNRSHPSVKFVGAAFGWLIVAMALLVLEPIHLQTAGMGFSHAFTGAVRHAVTVGFISQMILGVAIHVVGAWSKFIIRSTPVLWTAFILLNLGNLARVTLEIATDYSPGAFRWMGVTGFIELIGLLCWASVVVPALLRSKRQEAAYA